MRIDSRSEQLSHHSLICPQQTIFDKSSQGTVNSRVSINNVPEANWDKQHTKFVYPKPDQITSHYSPLSRNVSSNLATSYHSELDASASQSTSSSCTTIPLTKRERWITNDSTARLRCYMGIKASLPAHEQERLSRHLREEVRLLAGIPRSYPYTTQEYKRQGENIWMDMITRIV